MIGRALSSGEHAALAHVPARDRERARLVVVPCLTTGAAGMTVGRWILLRRSHEHDQVLLAHELVHVQQWREHGAGRFLYRYLVDYLHNRCDGMGHWEAYRAIPFEAEARALADVAAAG